MNNYKKQVTILLVGLMFLVLISVNGRASALSISDIKGMVDATNNDATVITEYDIGDDTYIDINSISLEGAVDSSCDNSVTEYNNNVTGQVVEISADGSVTQLSDDNSTLYYIGEAEIDGSISDDNQALSDDFSDMPTTIEVENWQLIEGELSIMVNKEASCVTIYKGATPIKAMICSAGESTPEGTFYMDNKWDWLMLIKGQYGRYCSQISGDYLFHSVPYNSMDIYDLDTEMYNQLGTLCSHGCIRLTVEDAKWIYDNCPAGTEITIYNDSNPGPLGKPGFEQIPDTQTWDPTDTDIED